MTIKLNWELFTRFGKGEYRGTFSTVDTFWPIVGRHRCSAKTLCKVCVRCRRNTSESDIRAIFEKRETIKQYQWVSCNTTQDIKKLKVTFPQLNRTKFPPVHWLFPQSGEGKYTFDLLKMCVSVHLHSGQWAESSELSPSALSAKGIDAFLRKISLLVTEYS